MGKKKEDQIEELYSVLNQVIDWLKFAESKNGALLAAESAAIFAFFSAFSQIQYSYFSIWGLIYLGILLVCLFVSLLYCLISFIPDLNLSFKEKINDCSEDNNLCFFAHIAELSPEEYLSRFYEKREIKFKEINKFELDLAQQIVINSKIACRKYKLFEIAIKFTFAGIVTPIGAYVIYKIKNIKH